MKKYLFNPTANTHFNKPQAYEGRLLVSSTSNRIDWRTK
jgi:hypothetical protein